MPRPTYHSTRSTDEALPFAEALIRGLAPDGGLYIPTAIPELSETGWKTADDFTTLAQGVLRAWLACEVEGDVLDDLVADALNFPVPLVPLTGRWGGVHVLELFHGPTLSFKDFGARTMARLMGHFLGQRGQQRTILVATSGDTGSAVADGFAGIDGIEVVLLYPKGKVSPTQEQQLIVERPGVRTFAVDGVFDDCQRMVKAAFIDPDLKNARLSSANSINIGRLLPQMLYYIWAIKQLGPATVCVPSGNLGNLTGGLFAQAGGVPIQQFVAAHNANDFFPHYLADDPNAAFAATVPTLSNAMDVGAPSNFERLDTLFGAETLRQRVLGHAVTDDATLATMRAIADETGYIACPHTAVGLTAVQRLREAEDIEEPVVVMATAHPAKFPDIVERATGSRPPVPAGLAELANRPTRVTAIAPTLSALKAVLA
ncbi:MAG: threonine synthase [Rhodothermales bacterium]